VLSATSTAGRPKPYSSNNKLAYRPNGAVRTALETDRGLARHGSSAQSCRSQLGRVCWRHIGARTTSHLLVPAALNKRQGIVLQDKTKRQAQSTQYARMGIPGKHTKAWESICSISCHFCIHKPGTNSQVPANSKRWRQRHRRAEGSKPCTLPNSSSRRQSRTHRASYAQSCTVDPKSLAFVLRPSSVFAPKLLSLASIQDPL